MFGATARPDREGGAGLGGWRSPALSLVAAAVLFAGVTAGLSAAPSARPEAPPPPAPGAVIPNAYLVTLAGGEPAAVAAEHARLGAVVEHVFSIALRGYTARMSPGLAREVARDPRVRSVVADRAVRASAQDLPVGVQRVGAPGSSAKVGDGAGDVDADIAVLDTGIDLQHPDLRVAGGVDCVTRTEASLPGFEPAESFDDERGHGTHIAGIAAALDNGVGVAGVAPGARVWAVRVLDSDGNGSLGTLLCGIEWVTANAATIEVANMSLTGLDPDRGCGDGALHEAICRAVLAGVTFTAAAGNESADAGDYSPAAYDEVITVSALADYDGRPGGLAATPRGCVVADDEFASFSNHGPDVDLVAPGVCVLSAWTDGGYATVTGTSQAAAHVAGAAALYLAANPDATPEEVRVALRGAGSSEWFTDSDSDDVPDPLLDVTAF